MSLMKYSDWSQHQICLRQSRSSPMASAPRLATSEVRRCPTPASSRARLSKCSSLCAFAFAHGNRCHATCNSYMQHYVLRYHTGSSLSSMPHTREVTACLESNLAYMVRFGDLPWHTRGRELMLSPQFLELCGFLVLSSRNMHGVLEHV